MRVQAARSYKKWREKKERIIIIILVIINLVYVSILEIVGRLDKGYI